MYLSSKFLSGKTKNQCSKTINFISSAWNCLGLPTNGQMGQRYSIECV